MQTFFLKNTTDNEPNCQVRELIGIVEIKSVNCISLNFYLSMLQDCKLNFLGDKSDGVKCVADSYGTRIQCGAYADIWIQKKQFILKWVPYFFTLSMIHLFWNIFYNFIFDLFMKFGYFYRQIYFFSSYIYHTLVYSISS